MTRDENTLGRAEKAGFSFLVTDLDLAITMAHIASQSGQDPEKRNRNRDNARRAFDSVSRLTQKAVLDEGEREQVNEKLAKLKSALKQLGESF